MAKSPAPQSNKDEEDEKPIPTDLLPISPVRPDIGMDDAKVESTEFDYSIRAKEDWVIGGPLGIEVKEAWEDAKTNKPNSKFATQRWFETWEDAEEWAREKYGARLKCRKPPEPGDLRKWAFIIRGPRG